MEIKPVEVITLESVAASFQQWRETRMSHSEPIPEELWNQAVALYPQHKRSIICRQLRLGASQFNQHLANKNTSPAGSGFVLASHEIVKETPTQNTTVELSIQGASRNLKISVGVDLLSAVLPHVSALL
jgi:hypothetical protein